MLSHRYCPIIQAAFWMFLCGLLAVPSAISIASPVVLPGRSVARDPAMFEEIDADKDGKITEVEFVNYELRRRFAAADVDKDGRLSRDEYVASIKNEVGERNAEAAWKLMNGGKKYITLEDFLRQDRAKKRVSAEFQKLDLNGDGHISMTESSKAKPPAKRSGAGK